MRNTFFLLFIGVFQLYATDTYSQNTRLTLDLKNVQVGDILKEIENRSEFYFLFNTRLVDVQREASISVKDEKISDILATLFSGTGVVSKVFDKQIVLTNSELITSDSKSPQQQNVTGKITDASTGEAIPGANIVVKGTTIGAVTSSNGTYSIPVSDRNATLIFTFIGYVTQEIPVSGKTTIDVALKSETRALDEVVVIGYGTAKKSDLTGSVISVNAEKLQTTLGANITKSLQGTVPGLEITNSSFRAGATQIITIRGEKSISAGNTPLIILDGVPFEGNLNDINPSDVESINVLKDASASAIYGARASSGVIIISTKQGIKGKLHVSFTNTTGVASISHKVDLESPSQYIDQLVEYNRYRFGTVKDPLALLRSAEIPNYNAGITTDWIDLAYRKNAFQQNDELSISGGSDKATYYNSIGYHKQEGLAMGNQYTRITARSNVKYNPTNWLEVGTNLQFGRSDYGGQTPSLSAVVYSSPYGQVKNPDGTWCWYPIYPATYNYSPFADQDATVTNLQTTGIFNGYFVFKPLKGLSYRLNGGYYITTVTQGDYYGMTTMTGSAVKGQADISNRNTSRYTIENILDYKLNLRAHSFGITGLYSREGNTTDNSSLSGQGFVSDATLNYAMGSAAIKNLSSSFSEYYIESLMGRLNYNYNNLYYLTLTVRRDGYSGFGENNKHATFPSGAISWNISDESFFKNASFLGSISQLKLRFSYGTNGNMAIPPYRTLDSFSSVPQIFGDNFTTINGLLNSVIGNPSLKWESTTSANLALDFGILKNRISGTFEVWQSHSNDLLMSQSVPVANGYTSVWNNVGQVGNKGIEVLVNGAIIAKTNFSWNATVNYSANRDEILALASGMKQDLNNKWFVGSPLRVNYDYKRDGIWQLGQEAEIAASPQKGQLPGYVKVMDVDGDGKITSTDRVIQGQINPKWRAGLTNIFKYKKFTLSAFINSSGGNIMPNTWLNSWPWPLDKNSNFTDIPYWSPTNPSNRYPSVGWQNPYDPNLAFYQEVSYIRIKDLTLSYDFAPKGIISKWGMTNLQLSVNCKNLTTITNWVGWDPEQPQSLSYSGYGTDPCPRELSFSIKIDF